MKTETQFQNNMSTESIRMFSVEENEKIADVLNTLLQINNDRIEGYGRAANETEDADLKLLFNGMAAKSKLFISQLGNEVRKHGGKPTESTTTSGKAFRMWMDFKAILTGKDRKAILTSCEFGEDAAQKAYKLALESDAEMNTEVRQLIANQKDELKSAHDTIKKLRDVAKAVNS